MNWIFYVATIFLCLLLLILLVLYISIKKDSYTVHAGRYILNNFEPDNTAPKLTDLIEFHKKIEHSKYKIN